MYIIINDDLHKILIAVCNSNFHSIHKMEASMEMEFRTNEQELQQFQFRFVREIWPTEGMRCKVDG